MRYKIGDVIQIDSGFNFAVGYQIFLVESILSNTDSDKSYYQLASLNFCGGTFTIPCCVLDNHQNIKVDRHMEVKMIDWTKPELYCHAKTGADIAEVHIFPEWVGRIYPVAVRFKDGLVRRYTKCGKQFESGNPEVIPKPRKPRVVEGWTKEGFSRNGGWSFVVHQVEQVGERWVKVRVEEVTDEPA